MQGKVEKTSMIKNQSTCASEVPMEHPQMRTSWRLRTQEIGLDSRQKIVGRGINASFNAVRGDKVT